MLSSDAVKHGSAEMRMMRFRELMMALLPLLSFGSAASVVSSSSCTSVRLQEKVQNFKSEPFEAAFNGDSIPIRCDYGFEPMNTTAQAQCVEGAWEIPVDFQCVLRGFCRPPFKPGPSIKILRTRSDYRSKNDPYKNIFHDGEQVIVKCKDKAGSKDSPFTQSFKCQQGSWFPAIVPPCDHVPCPSLPALENGLFRIVSDGVAGPECNAGFQHKGSKSLSCLHGNWSVKPEQEWPWCARNEVTKTPSTPLEQLQWIALGAGILVLIVGVVISLFCYLRKDSPKRNRLMHSTSHVDELLHLRRTKPIIIPDPVSHTQVHYTHDRKPIPVTSL